MQIRAGEAKHPTVIVRYALKLARKSAIMGGGAFSFRAHIARHALDNAAKRNVVALFNQAQNLLLGRTGVNLEQPIADTGLCTTQPPPELQLGRAYLENVRLRIISQSAFALQLAPDMHAQCWQCSAERGVKTARTINNIAHLLAVSPEPTPAYPDTAVCVGARSLEQIMPLDQPPEWELCRRCMLYQQHMQELLCGIE